MSYKNWSLINHLLIRDRRAATIAKNNNTKRRNLPGCVFPSRHFGAKYGCILSKGGGPTYSRNAAKLLHRTSSFETADSNSGIGENTRKEWAPCVPILTHQHNPRGFIFQHMGAIYPLISWGGAAPLHRIHDLNTKATPIQVKVYD